MARKNSITRKFSSSDEESLFLSHSQWEMHRKSGEFDYIVLGSSFCAFGFVNQMLKNNANAKILILERGDFISPETLREEVTPDDLGEEEKGGEIFPWNFHPDENELTITGEKGVRGLNCVFGGRSLFWKAWSPRPRDEEIAEWPKTTTENVSKYFPDAEKLLSVRPVTEIKNKGIKVCEQLQDNLSSKLCPRYKEIIPAPLAAVEKKCRFGDYQKYSVLEPLLNILERKNVKAVLNCTVKRIKFNYKGDKAVSLETSGSTDQATCPVTIGKAKVILAISTLPSTTLMLNSLPQSSPYFGKIGMRFTGHFASYVFARIPAATSPMFSPLLRLTSPQLAALHIPQTFKYQDTMCHYHMQLTALVVGENGEQNDIMIMKNLFKTPKPKMLKECKNHVVLVCAAIGELDHKNRKNRFCLNGREDITCNADLHFTTNERDRQLWDKMDEATFEMLECLSPEHKIQYWNNDTENWHAERPSSEAIRSKSLVHPASTMWLGEGAEDPVDLEYRFRGLDNVYLTGGALWPTAGSWNPTCTMTAMAMHLADILHRKQIESCLTSHPTGPAV